MKRLLVLSVLLNAVLLGLIWRQAQRQAPMPRAPRGEVGEPAARRNAPSQPTGPDAAARPSRWSGIESRDPRQLMANLRAIGCPEATVRDLVVMRVCRDYRARLLAEEEQAAKAWDFTRNRANADWRERNARQRELRDQMNAELEALLGQSFGQYGVGVAYLGFSDGTPDFLSIEKRRAVRETEARFRRLTEALESDRTLGLLDAEGAARLSELRRQQQAELAQLLTPQEAEEHLYRESPAARYVRERMPPAKSEAEFRAIVRLAAELELDPESGNDFASRIGQPPADPALAQAEADRQAEFQRRLEDLLGKERLAEQAKERQAEAERERLAEQERREQEQRARFTEIAEAVGVESAAAERFMDRLKELQPTLESRFTELEKTLTGTPEEKKSQMQAAVKAELEAQAVAIMGDKGRDFLRKMDDGGF